jgi:hypothetical protein
MSSVSDLIHSSFRLIGAIAAGETLETNELNDAFVSLNQMIGVWNTEGPSVYARKQALIPVAANNSVYALSERPIHIDSASLATSNIDCPLDIVDAVGWEAIQEKNATAVIAQKLYCDYLYPTATVRIWPVPRVGGTLELWIYAAILSFQTVNDVIDLPPGYEIALRYNFAVAVLPEYPRSQADPSLPAQAQMYKASLSQLNAGNVMRSQTPSDVQAAAANVGDIAR